MLVVTGGSPTPFLSSCALPTLPFLLSPTLLPHVFKASENKKKKKEKRHVCEGKEADGLARGKRIASLLRPQSGAGVPFLCVSMHGVWVQFAEP